MVKFLRFTLMSMLTMLCGMVYADTYSYTFEAGQFAVADFTNNAEQKVLVAQKELGGLTWTVTAAEGFGYCGYDDTKGQQFGSGSAPAKSLKIAIEGIAGTISSVKVNTSGASSIVGTLKVTVGGTEFGDTYTLTKTATAVDFPGSASGTVELSYAQTSSKAIYIKSIEVTYSMTGDEKKMAEVKFDRKSVELVLGEAFTAPTLTKATTADVAYSSSDETVATVDAVSGEVSILAAGTTTITATAPENDEYLEGSDYYTILVKEPKLTEVSLPYEEPFDEDEGNFVINDVSLGEGLSSVWTFATNSGNKFMKASSYNGGKNYDAESWLVSPLIDMTGAEFASLSFDQCINKFFGNVEAEATLWAQEEGGEWEQLTIGYPEVGTSTYSAFEPETVDLKEYAGKKIRIGFKYIGTATTAGTWEIRNLVVTGGAKQEAGMEFSVKEVTLRLGDEFTKPELWRSTDADVVFASDNEEVATVDEETGDVTIVGVGVAVITATAEETDGYNAGSASYTITVKAAKLLEVDVPYSEPFAEDEGNFTINDVNLGEGLSYVWKHDSSYGYMKASAYAGGNKEAESWLVSPVISLEGQVSGVLTFDHCINKYFGNAEDEITVWVKEVEGEWIQQTITIPEITSGNWSAFTPESINLSGFDGKKIQVGFKYTSTADAAGTWEVKNFSVTATPSGISGIETNGEGVKAPAYNLAGQRVNESYKGIVVKNGRKYLNR